MGTRPRSMACAGNCLQLPRITASKREASVAITDHLVLQHEKIGLINTVYKPLERGQTRIIRIPPCAVLQGQIRIELLVADVMVSQGLRIASSHDNVNYTALSYCWQTDADYVKVLCNGQNFVIARNLAEAILFLQNPHQDVFLWIDAVSINQADDTEKAAQVVMMFDLYLKAEQVLAWLGESADDSDFAMCCLAQPQVAIELDRITKGHQQYCQTQINRAYKALLALYDKRAYLRRTWIRQELFAARHIVFVCGHRRIASSFYFMGRRFLQLVQPHVNDRKLKNPTAVDRICRALYNAAEGRREGSRWPILHDLKHVLMQASAYDPSLEQDTIYAVLQMCGVLTTSNIVEHNEQARFLIDYQRTLADLYHDITLRMLAERSDGQRSLWRYYTKPPGRGLPSWVMNWRQSCCSQEEASMLETLDREDMARIWGPLSPVVALPRPKYKTDDNFLLEIPAYIVDYVADVFDMTLPLVSFVALYTEEAGITPSLIELNDIRALLHYQWRWSAFVRPRWDLQNRLLLFDEACHTRRLAILGSTHGSGLALVPASTAKGDLVVLTASELLPLILSPCQPSPLCRKLSLLPNPYEELIFWHSIFHLRPKLPWHSLQRFISGRLSQCLAFMLLVWSVHTSMLGFAVYCHYLTINDAILSSGYVEVWVSVFTIICSLLALNIVFSGVDAGNAPEDSLAELRRMKRQNSSVLAEIEPGQEDRFELKGPVLVRSGSQRMHEHDKLSAGERSMRTFIVQ